MWACLCIHVACILACMFVCATEHISVRMFVHVGAYLCYIATKFKLAQDSLTTTDVTQCNMVLLADHSPDRPAAPATLALHSDSILARSTAPPE